MGLVFWFLERHRRRQEEQRREKVLCQYGWDGRCAGCEGWHHRDDLVLRARETPDHIHYLCKCGCTTHWNAAAFGIVMAREACGHVGSPTGRQRMFACDKGVQVKPKPPKTLPPPEMV